MKTDGNLTGSFLKKLYLIMNNCALMLIEIFGKCKEPDIRKTFKKEVTYVYCLVDINFDSIY